MLNHEIVTRLARALQVELTEAEASRVARAHPENPDAEELALQCEAGYLRFGLQRKEMLPAYALCEQALRIDNRNVRALAILALRLVVRVYILQSVDHAAELDEAAVAGALDHTTMVHGDGRINQIAGQRPESRHDRGMDFRANLVAQIAALKAENADLRAQLAAATKGRSERADAAWRSTLHEAKRLVREPNWEWHRLAAAEMAAEARARAAKPDAAPVVQVTPEAVLRAKGIAEGTVTPLPATEAARAILRANAKAKNEE